MLCPHSTCIPAQKPLLVLVFKTQLVARVCCDCWEVADLDSTLRLAPDRPRTRLQAGPALTRHQPQTAASHNQTSCFSCFSSFSFFSSFSSFSPFSSSSSCFSSSSYCSSSPLQRPPPASCSSANAICATPLTVGCSTVAANYCHCSIVKKILSLFTRRKKFTPPTQRRSLA